jgi:hypothetical protein
MQLLNCTFYGNSGGAVNPGVGAVFRNCIIDGSVGVPGRVVDVDYSLVILGKSAFQYPFDRLLKYGFNNLTGNPRFINVGKGDFRLNDDSALIGAGGPNLVGVATYRVADPAGSALDIGALENSRAYPVVRDFSAFGVIKNNICKGASDGEIGLFIANGVDPLIYSWTGPMGFKSDLKNISGLLSGEYKVAVSGSNQRIEKTFVVREPSQIVLASTICGKYPNVTLSITPSGGVPPYKIAWGDGSAGLQKNIKYSGKYDVAVTDAQGCLFSKTIDVPDVLESKVIYVSALGDDSNNGSRVSPFKNLQFAIDSACDDDTIILSRAVHKGSVNFSGKSIILRSDFLGDRPNIDDIAQTVVEGQQDGLPVIATGSGGNPQLIGFTVKNGTSSGLALGGGYVGSSIVKWVVSDNNLGAGFDLSGHGPSLNMYACTSSSNQGAGVHLYNHPIEKWNIEGCSFINNVGPGFNYRGSVLTLKSCLIANNGGVGINAWENWELMQLLNCTFYGNSGGAVNPGVGAVFRNCIIDGSVGVPGRVVDVDYSLVVLGKSAFQYPFDRLLNYGINNLVIDPRFVSPSTGDFRLRDDSPAINAGDNSVITDGSATDLDGKKRILGGRVDLGAYERWSFYTERGLTAAEGTPVSAKAVAEDIAAMGGVKFQVESGPEGLAVDSTSGQLTWTPTEALGPGTYTAVVRGTAANNLTATDTQTLTLTATEVNRTPEFASAILQTTTERLAWAYTAAATDPDLPANRLTYRLFSGPAGATVAADSGLLKWTPGEAEGGNSYDFVVEATDNGTPALSAQTTVRLEVQKINHPPTLASLSNRAIPENQTWTAQAVGQDLDLPAQSVTYSVQSGPSGLTVDASSGLIQWTPSEAQGPGKYPVTVRVQDPQGLTADQTFELSVTEVNEAPTLAAVPTQVLNYGQAVSLQLPGTDKDLPANALAYRLVSGPTNAVISIDGKLTWSPVRAQAPSTNLLMVAISDGVLSVTNSIQIEVQDLMVVVNGREATNTVATLPPAVVSLSFGRSDWLVFYSVDGTEPTDSSFFYTEALELESSATVWPVAFSADFKQSVKGNPIRINVQKPQTLTMDGGLGSVYQGESVAIRGVSDSGLPVVLEVVSGPGRLAEGRLEALGAGVVRIKATQAGNEVWAAASIEVERTMARAPQALTWEPISQQTFGANAITLVAKSDRNLPLSYAVISGPGTVSGDQLVLTGAGSVVVKAIQSGTTNYLPANQEYSVVVAKAAQTLSFGAIANRAYTKTPLTLAGNASSGLPVSFEVVTGPATVANNTVSLSGVGTVLLRARQGGNSNYLEALSKDQSFVVSKANQTVSFAALSGVNYGTAPITLLASSSAGLPIGFRVVSGAGTISGNILTVSGAGELVMEASQEGNELYLPAKATQTVSVGKANQAITFEALADVAFSTNAIALKATAGSGLPVSFRVVSGGANVSSNALSLSGVGVIQVAAEQAGNTNWLAAAGVTNRFTVSRGVQVIDMSSLRDQLLGSVPVTLGGVSSAGLTVNYTVMSGPASLSSGKLTLLNEGTVVVRAYNPGSTLWLAAQTDASFAIRKQTSIEVTVSGNVGGSVSVSPQKALYEPLETVMVTALAANGYAFSGWSGDLEGVQNPGSLGMGANRKVVASFKDVAKPVLQWTSPVAGTTGDERAVLSGKLTDNAGVHRASWRRDGGIEQVLSLGSGGEFLVENITLSSGANRFTVKGLDVAGNEVSEERVVVWEPQRVLRLADSRDVQEGQRVVFPLTLTTPGDVAGLTFRLNYDASYLADPKVELSALVGQSVNSINTGELGVISGAFALAGTELPVGVIPVATVSFRARSVPMVLTTEVRAEIDSMSSANGSALPIGNATMSGWGRIKPRRIKGDNNANQRVDIGDATVISRLQVGLEEKRSWDVALNDLNGSQTIDSGDTVKALRIVVGMDAQPVATASDTKSLARASAHQATEAVDLPRQASSKLNRTLAAKSGTTPTERGEWTLPSVAPVVGQTYRVQISLKDLTNAISGLSMKIKYPISALRLENAQSMKAGAWVPTAALAMWNVGPTSTDYVNQNGSVSVAITSQNDWVGTGGVIAELTFRVQAGLTGQATWPIELSEMELTGSGFDIRSLSAVTVQVPVDANAVASRKVSGKVEYYLSTQGGVRGVSLNITEGGGRSAVSAADGTYTIDAPDTGAVTLTPSYATDAPIANGVTTADITLIRRHVLGLTLLDSPYKVMAGDVNGSDSVTTADITLIRRLILGTATTFSGGLWRFVPSDEAFTNTAKPWTATRMRQYAALASGTLSGQDFKAIKLGDVNGSWKAPTVTTGSMIKSKAKGRLTVGKVRAEAGKTVNIPVSLAGVNQLGSAQMTLSWDASAASYEGVEGLSLGGLSRENLGLARVNDGELSLSWDHPSGRVVDLTGTAGLFQLKLRPKATRAKRIEIRVTEGPTRLELTDGDTEVMAAVDSGWLEIGAPGEVVGDSVSLRFVGLNSDGRMELEARGPEGMKLNLEASDTLRTWAEVQSVTGQGPDSPVKVTLQPDPNVRVKFWRVRVR